MTVISAAQRHALNQMQTDLRQVERTRDRVRALKQLVNLLRCEYSGTKTIVSTKGTRWWHRPERAGGEPEEIILSDAERREFSDWCLHRAEELERGALETELKYASGKGS